jgi:hypothetical protein
MIYVDFQYHSCIEIERANGVVRFIAFDISGLRITRKLESTFDEEYKPYHGCTLKSACETYLSFGRYIGESTKEALNWLEHLRNSTPIPKTEQENEMPHSQDELRKDNERAAAAAAGKKPGSTKAPAKGKPAAKPAPAKGKPAASDKKKATAAQMFINLIMEGKLTDDQIFAKVKAEFNLDDKKRGYVNWYRNYLKKQNRKPPEAKVAK